jgi:hypothetical protein
MLATWIVALLWVVPAFAVEIGPENFAADAMMVDFEGPTPALPSVPGVRFMRVGSMGQAEDWYAGGAAGHNGELFGSRALSGLAFRGNFSAVGVTFDDSVEAAGAWVSGLGGTRYGQANLLTISAFDVAGNLLDRVEMELGLEGVFVGFRALAGIARLEWVGDNEGFFGVDNMRAGDFATVPEPGTAALMGLGLLGLATVGRRKA